MLGIDEDLNVAYNMILHFAGKESIDYLTYWQK